MMTGQMYGVKTWLPILIILFQPYWIKEIKYIYVLKCLSSGFASTGFQFQFQFQKNFIATQNNVFYVQ